MLEVKGLTCERDDRVLFQNLSFTLSPGDLMRVEGANGSGKTTLLRMLAGLISAKEGRISWQGEPLANSMTELHQTLLFIGHRSAVKPGLTALENLRFLQGLHDGAKDKDFYHALDLVGLRGYEDVYCRNLSAGQQRRVGLARLYLSTAQVWVLDEIFTAIDKQGVRQLEDLLSERARNGGVVIFTTHHSVALEGLQSLELGYV